MRLEMAVLGSTVVGIDTEITGYGEVCPLGPFYLPVYAAGLPAGVAELGLRSVG